MSFQLDDLHHVSLLVTDLPRALRFYCDLLGLAQNRERPDLGYPGAWLDIGRYQIHLLQLPSPDLAGERPEHGGRDRHTAFRVAGLGALAESLEQAGIAYTLSRSGRAAMFCRDPDGNALEFIEQDTPD